MSTHEYSSANSKRLNRVGQRESRKGRLYKAATRQAQVSERIKRCGGSAGVRFGRYMSALGDGRAVVYTGR